MPITKIPVADTTTKDGITSLYTVDGHATVFTMHADFLNIQTETAFMLVNLSDTSNWKHTNTGHIYVLYMHLAVDPNSTYLGNIECGFLTNVDGDNGDFNRFVEIDMHRKSDVLVESFFFGGGGFDCETDHHFGPITANSTLFQTDVNLTGPNASTTPSGNGDLCLVVGRDAGTVDVAITVGYQTVA